mgnify:CR=1 FL=1
MSASFTLTRKTVFGLLAAGLLSATALTTSMVVAPPHAVQAQIQAAIDPTKGFADLVDQVMPAVISVEVKYAIHPVAGRMPGHMNVLLAEADVPYDKLLEMEQANDEFKSTDVVLVLGANDVVNPAAKTDPSSPIYGMPILEVERAKNTIVNKRSMKPGYAGIENQLFFQPKTSMLFGDAKKVLQSLVTEIKSV